MGKNKGESYRIEWQLFEAVLAGTFLCFSDSFQEVCSRFDLQKFSQISSSGDLSAHPFWDEIARVNLREATFLSHQSCHILDYLEQIPRHGQARTHRRQ